MRTIETDAYISHDGKLIAQAGNIPAGKYRVVIIMEDNPIVELDRNEDSDFPVIDLGQWPQDLSLSREDIYEDR